MTMSEVGKFGLPLPPSPFLSEPAPERLKRIASVKALVLEVFNLTKVHLGKEEARRLFVSVTHGKKGKRAAEQVNSELLRLYDAAVVASPGKVSLAPRQVAKDLGKTGQAKQYGASPEAIIKKINRLVTAREEAEFGELKAWEANRSGKYPSLLVDLVIEDLRKRVSNHRSK
jgi:hypothetical protein